MGRCRQDQQLDVSLLFNYTGGFFLVPRVRPAGRTAINLVGYLLLYL